MKAIVSGAAFALLSALSPIAAQEAGHHDHAAGAHGGERIGTVSFANSGSPAAQRPFLRGLALLHSFEYDDARAEFRDAERADSGFAMAYWGEALTFAQLLWGIDYADSARAALARFGATRDARLARAKTERERLYGVAVEALFDTTSLESRVRGYVAGLRAVRAAQPNDLDARAFLAVSLLMDQGGSADDEKARTEESIVLAQSVFAAAPQHPGGAHYLIHAADNPKYAAKGLAAARAYAKIAPDAEHALHMPSHIFVQVGAWDDVVSSNERAWPASRAWVKSHAMPNTELSFHSLWWLQYGYLQQGRFAAAKALLDTVRMTLAGTDWATSEATDARHAELQFSYLYARETGDWSVYGGRTPGPVVVNPKLSGERVQFFATAATAGRAVIAALLGDTAQAKLLLDSLPERAAITRGEVAGLLAKARGDTANWIASLEAVAKLDAGIGHLGPPSSYPPSELLGDALVAAGRPKDAIVAYRQQLELMPNRSRTLLLLARAQRKAGDVAGAAKTEAQLRRNWHAADAGVATRLAQR